jgi:hypothetical protein
MTASREAIGLPMLFLTVLLLGGLRLGGVTALLPPSLFALVLGTLVIRVLVQSGAMAHERLLSASRTTLANVNGFVVLLTLWAAAAQTFALVTPDSGLPRVAVNVMFFVTLLNTAAAAPAPAPLVRSLAVTLGSAWILKFVVLSELSAPGAGWLKGVLQAMLEGLTLGVLLQPVQHPGAGYLAFLALAMFLGGVTLLPRRSARDGLERRQRTGAINRRLIED